MRIRYREFQYTLCFHTCMASSRINILYKSRTLFTIDKPTLTHYNQPKSIACILVHSWCCTFLLSLKTWYVELYVPVQNDTEYSHCPKSPLFYKYSSLSIFATIHVIIFSALSLFPESLIVGIILMHNCYWFIKEEVINQIPDQLLDKENGPQKQQSL